MIDDKSSGQSAAVTLEAGIEKLISIANKAIAGGASTHLGLAMLESNLILILRATAKAADISRETIRGLRDENAAMLDLLRRLEVQVACTCSDTADAAECARDEGAAVDCGCVCHPLAALLDKHGRSK